MTRTLANLEHKGYVAKASHPTDRRQVLVQLTDAGIAIVAATRSRRDAWLARRLAALEPEQRTVLAEAARIISTLNSAQ
jgi:DNA-binding MarR family transcriptional regulator